MISITLKYINYGPKETTEFRDYVKNLVGYLEEDIYNLRFGVEQDNMFDDKIVANMTFSKQNGDLCFDILNHFMMDREVNRDNIAFDVDLSSVAVYVTGSEALFNYLTSWSMSKLYERMEIAENVLTAMMQKYEKLSKENENLSYMVRQLGIDKFPDIVKQLVDSMETEGHHCKEQINEIINRKAH